jgi:putative sigma-54 modulation protein
VAPEEQVEEVVLATLGEGRHVLLDEDYPHKPMTLEEAALRLQDEGRGFLVFRDAASQRLGVLYLRDDGNLGLVQPDS